MALRIPPNPPVQAGEISISEHKIIFKQWGPTAVLYKRPAISSIPGEFYYGRFVGQQSEGVRLRLGVVFSKSGGGWDDFREEQTAGGLGKVLSRQGGWPYLQGYVAGLNEDCKFDKWFFGVPAEIAEKSGWEPPDSYGDEGLRRYDIEQMLNSFLPPDKRIDREDLFKAQIDEDATVEQALPEGLRELASGADR